MKVSNRLILSGAGLLGLAVVAGINASKRLGLGVKKRDLRRAQFGLAAIMALVLVVPGAWAQKLLNFDGLQAGESPRDYYNGGLGSAGSGPGPNLGVVFPLAPVECVTATGFSPAPPSPPNALTWGESDTCYFNVPAGFTGSLSFFYLSLVTQPKAVTVFAGPDRSGAVLAEVDLPAQATEWSRFVVNFSGTARSVYFHHLGIAVDNVMIGSPFKLFTADTPFQVRHAANLNLGESWINITNSGANGAPLLGPGFGGAAGNICANVYAFSPDEQLISCCSCLVTPNGLVNLGVNRDLTSKTLTGVIPTSVVVKLLATLAGTGGEGTSCSNSAATVSTATAVPGMLAWGTHIIYDKPVPDEQQDIIETPFSPATLSAGELASIGGRCASILGNGSGFGICRSCQAGALGAATK